MPDFSDRTTQVVIGAILLLVSNAFPSLGEKLKEWFSRLSSFTAHKPETPDAVESLFKVSLRGETQLLTCEEFCQHVDRVNEQDPRKPAK